MVDERFTASAKGKYLLYHIYDNGKEIPPAEVIDLLNEQAERIKLLEDDILAQTMTINNLEGVLKVAQKENEQLRFQLEECSNNKLFSRRELERENEQLKEENKRLKRNVKTFKEDRDSNFKSTQYFREQLMKIPESIREVWIDDE